MFVRTREGDNRLAAWFEAISDPGFGKEIFRRGVLGLDLLTQLADEDAQVFRLLGAVRSPDGSQERAMGYDFAGPAREIHEEIKFLGREMDYTAGNLDRTGVEIDGKISGDNGTRGFFGLGSSSQLRADSGEKLVHAEGFCNVIIGSSLERLYL